jgi:hypothetical protein
MTDTRCFLFFCLFLFSLSLCLYSVVNCSALLSFFLLSSFFCFRHVHAQVEDDDTQAAVKKLEKQDAEMVQLSSAPIFLFHFSLFLPSVCSPLISLPLPLPLPRFFCGFNP